MTFKGSKRPAMKLAGAAVLALHAGAALAAPKEAGIWYDDTGKGAVKIEVCGDKLCGRIFWLKETLNAEGKPLRDKHNPNQSQQNRPICGLQVIGGLVAMQDGEWDTGWIYDPKEGKSYSVALKLADSNTLKVTGYLVMKMMGRTLTWTRAPSDLPSCAGNAAAAPQASPASAKATAPKPTPPPSKVAAPLPEEQAQAEPAPQAEEAAPQPAPAPAAKAGTPAAKAAPDNAGTSKVKKSAAKSEGTAKSAGEGQAAQKPAVGAAKPDKGKKGSDGTKSAAKSKSPEQLPWTAKEKAPAAGQMPTAEASVPVPSAPVAVKPARPEPPDDQARPFQ